MFKFRYLSLKLNPTFISGKSQSHFCILNKFTSITHTEYRPKAVAHSQHPNKNPLNLSPLWPRDCPRHGDAALLLPSLLGNLCNPRLKQRLYERWAASRETSLYVSLHKAFGSSCVPTEQPLGVNSTKSSRRAPCTALLSKRCRWEPGRGQRFLSWLTRSEWPLPASFPTGGLATGPFHHWPWRLSGGIWQPSLSSSPHSREDRLPWWSALGTEASSEAMPRDLPMRQELLLPLCCGLSKATLLSAMAFDAVSHCISDHAQSPSMPGDKSLWVQHKRWCEGACGIQWT